MAEYELSFTAQEIDEKLGKIVDLDTTLTQSGKAADAKAVGDAIGQLSEESAMYDAELDMRTKPGKNLNVTPYEKTYTEYGITFVTHDDNSVTISGKAEGNHNIFWPKIANAVDARWPLPAGTYTLSGAYSPFCSITLFLYESQTATSPKGEYVQGGDNGAPRNVVVENDCWAIIRLNVDNRWNDGNATIYPQLEEGNFATSYVSPWTEEMYSLRLSTIESSMSELYATVNPLAVPDYYFANGYLPNKIARINELMRTCSNNGDVFVFITDTHWEKNAGKSPALLNYIRKNTHIDRLFGGGDYIDEANNSTEMYDVSNIFRDAWAGTLYFTLGNHDYMGGAAYRETDASLYYIWNSYGTERVGNLSRNYYYVDNQQMKMRYIVLNRYADRGDANAEIHGINEEQRTWLQDVALNVEDGWTVLVFAHDLYRFIYGEDGYTSTMNLNYSDSRATVEILDAFVSGGGTVAGIFCGEAHVDMVNYTPGGIPVITTTCDKNTGTEAALPIADQFAVRSSGTIKEQAFDVMIVDKANRAIHAVRIGYPARNSVEGSYGDLVEERTINY